MATISVPFHEIDTDMMNDQEYEAYLEQEVQRRFAAGAYSEDAESVGEAPEECVEDPATGQLLFWGMRLEDYEPIKAVGPRPVYYGPVPRPYGTQMWSGTKDAWYWLDEGIHSLDKLNKEDLNAKQREIERVYQQYQAMRDIQLRLDNIWYSKREPHRQRFYELMDRLSIQCYYCEHAHHAHEGGTKREYCECESEYEREESDQEW
jgi:hypothetical protein